MQRKLTWVLRLVIVFLILIDLLQLAWLYFSYKEQDNQYKQLIVASLGESVSMYQREKAQQNLATTSAFYVISTDSASRDIQLVEKGIRFSGNFRVDLVPKSLGYNHLMQLKDKDHLDLPFLDSIFKSIMLRNGLHTEYVLDTVPENKDQQRVETSDTTKLPTQKMVATKAIYPVKHEDYPIQSAMMLVNHFGDKLVYVLTKPNPGYILKKLAWILLSSFLIFVATNVALIFVVRTIRKQKKIDEIKNDFISNMTHELRTPITVATTAIDALLNHHGFSDEAKARQYLNTGREELLHLDQLVEKILNLATQDTEVLVLNYEIVELHNLVNAIVENYKMVSTKQLNIDVDIDPGIHLSADKIHLANALSNLIDNAIKYSGDPVYIYIHCWQQDKNISIEIKDKGIGIPKVYIQEIFKPFFRVPQRDRHDVKGFGLGLAYVKKVAEGHGSSVEVTSNDEGTSFTFSIPKDKPNGK